MNNHHENVNWECGNDSTLNIGDLPPEVLSMILSHVELPGTLLRCRLVCHSWLDTIQGKRIWSHKLHRKKDKHFVKLNLSQQTEFIGQTPWYILYKITTNCYPFGQNLLKNCCGQDGLMHWTFGDPSSWKAVKSDDDELPEAFNSEHSSIFDVTSRRSDLNLQTIINFHTQQINLPRSGLSSFISNMFQPNLTISFWISVKSNAGPQQMSYITECRLIDSNFRYKDYCGHMLYIRGRKWHKVSYTVENYGSSIKSIKFEGSFHFRPSFLFWVNFDESYDPYSFKIKDLTVTLDTPNFYDVNWGSLVNECYRALEVLTSSALKPSYPFYVGLDMNLKQPLDANLLAPSHFHALQERYSEQEIRQSGKWWYCSWPLRYSIEPEIPIILTLLTVVNLSDFGWCEFALDHIQPILEASMSSLYAEALSYRMKVRLISRDGTVLEEKIQTKEIRQDDGRQLFIKFERCSADVMGIEFTVEGIYECPPHVNVPNFLKTVTDTFHLQLSAPKLNTEGGDILALNTDMEVDC